MGEPFRSDRSSELLASVQALTRQVSRLAWAAEAAVLGTGVGYENAPCHACGSQLVSKRQPECSACGTEKRKVPDGER